jgi:predicted nuclease with TOPRIM domain
MSDKRCHHEASGDPATFPNDCKVCLRTALAESREREDNMRVLKEDAVKDAERAEAALTESRREVELYRGRLNDSTRDGSRLENTIATLRQEVERLKVKLANKHLNVSLNAEWDALRRQVEEKPCS